MVYPEEITVSEYQICPVILGKGREGVIYIFFFTQGSLNFLLLFLLSQRVTVAASTAALFYGLHLLLSYANIIQSIR